MLDIEYISLSSSISNDQNRPTIFDVVGRISIIQGEILFDILRWDTQVAGIAMAMNYRGQASGIIEGSRFYGEFQAEYESKFPVIPGFIMGMFGMGNFEVELDSR